MVKRPIAPRPMAKSRKLPAKRAPEAARAAPKRSRGKLAPQRQSRGLEAAQVAITLDSSDIAELASVIREAGGAPIGAYRDPLGGRALLLASLPLKAIQPT